MPILIQEGLEPNFQMVCRDRNRLAMQSDVLGVYALGIRNMLCLSGDHYQFGDHPDAKDVFDIDSMQLIATVKKMRDEGKFLSGADLDGKPQIFIGAASNPFADPFEFRVHRLAKKINAGADFSRPSASTTWPSSESSSDSQRHGADRKSLYFCGVTPLKSIGMARYMKEKVPGMDVPDEVINRLKGRGRARGGRGNQVRHEQIEEFKEMKGVAGVHLMAIEWEDRVPEIAERAGMLPRPQV